MINATTDDTVAVKLPKYCFLFEPIQAEVGVCVCRAVSDIDCSEHILFTARN